MKKDLLVVYRNLLFAIQYYENYGAQYGDTIRIIRAFERELLEAGVDIEPYRPDLEVEKEMPKIRTKKI